MLQAGAEPWVLHVRLNLLDDRTGGLVCLPGLLWSSGFGMEVSQSEVGLPELRRVTDRLGQRQGLLQPPLCLVPLAAGAGNFSLESPPFDYILARVGARGNVEALGDEFLCPGWFSTGQPEVSQAGKEVHGVAPLHPVAGGRMVHQAVDAVEELLGQRQVALRQKDVAQVQLGVGNGLVIVPLPGPLGPLSVEINGALQVPALAGEPPQAVEQAVAIDLVAHLF